MLQFAFQAIVVIGQEDTHPGGGGRGRDGLAKEIRRAGKHFGELAEGVRTVRKKAEKVGDAVS